MTINTNPYRDPFDPRTMWREHGHRIGDSIASACEYFATKYALTSLVLVTTALTSILYFLPHDYHNQLMRGGSSSSLSSSSLATTTTTSTTTPAFQKLNIVTNWDTSFPSGDNEGDGDDSDYGGGGKPPEVAWFMSFPGSGTEYVNYLVQEVSGTTTGTNYGFLSLPFVSDVRNGPFAHNDLPHPRKYLLTTTYCTGFCIDCEDGMYLYDRDDFREACATGLLLNGHEKLAVRYDPDIVNKAVHLFRNPIENIITRFQDEYNMRISKNDPDWLYNNDEYGFRQWCRDLDARFAKVESRWNDERVSHLAKHVPCHGALYQYVVWHNNVAEIAAQYGHRFEMLTLNYDDFGMDDENDDKRRGETVARLFEFLGLPVEGMAPRFPVFQYPVYYSERELEAVSAFLKVVCSQPTWIGIRRYLPVPKDEEVYDSLGTVMSPIYYGNWPSVVWLMSFPNSGTFFTTQFTQVRSRAAIATNYANEVGKNFEFIPHFAKTPNGPFRYSMRPFSDKYILTKTHCVGHCIECSPEQYVRTPQEFVKGCAKGGKYVETFGNLVKVFYDPNMARKSVHLVRNPFDNIVARFHFTFKEHKTQNDVGWTFPYDKDGFKAWCKFMDARYPSKDAQYFSDEVLDAAKGVPCHGEFYQYVQWHNNALKLPGALDIPGLVLYYEDFHYNLEEKMNGLLDYLELPKVGKVTEFKWKGGYDDHFTNQERETITKFIKLLATPETYTMLERYFDPEVARGAGWHDYFKTPT